MSTKIELSAEELLACAKRLRGLDSSELADEYRKEWNNAPHGCHVYLRVNPRTGEAWTHVAAGEECGEEEYYSEFGAASITTLISDQRAAWEPSPDDGYIWQDCEEGETSDYICNAACDDWMCGCSAERGMERRGIELPDDLGESELLAYMVANHGWHYFTVTYEPVDASSEDSDRITEALEAAAVACEEEAVTAA